MPKAPRVLVLGFAIALAAGSCGIAPGRAAELFAGGYSFSDELGGFRIVSASGSGTPADPVVVVEEVDEAAPITLVIRHRESRGARAGLGPAQLTLLKRVVNRSERVWAGFEVELQEILGKPSPYSDGLSFKQFGAEPPDVASDSFLQNERRFEPYDRIEFTGGSVDPDAMAEFRLTITDPTPVDEFYLVQDPKVLAAGLPRLGWSYALRVTGAPAVTP